MKLVTAAFLLLGLAACGGNNPPVKDAHDDLARAKKVVAKAGDDGAGKPELAVGTDVKAVCGITPPRESPEAKNAPILREQPKFGFDSYELTADEKNVLDQVAECLVRGALKGKSVTLVGRADARGEAEYNMTLGAHRANIVRTYLGEKGVEQARMRDTSRGALDATGTDEGGWYEDRRVDITLAY